MILIIEVRTISLKAGEIVYGIPGAVLHCLRWQRRSFFLNDSCESHFYLALQTFACEMHLKFCTFPAACTPSLVLAFSVQLSTLCCLGVAWVLVLVLGLVLQQRCLLHCSRRRCHYYPAAVIMHQVSLSLSPALVRPVSLGYKWASARRSSRIFSFHRICVFFIFIYFAL